MPTIVLHPKGKILSNWGQRTLDDLPVEEDVLTFMKNLRSFYMENHDLMCFGNIVKPLPYETDEVTYVNTLYCRSYTAQEVLSAAYELDGKKTQIFVNYNTEEKTIEVNGNNLTISALSVAKMEI